MSDPNELDLKILGDHPMSWWNDLMKNFLEESLDPAEVPVATMAVVDQVLPQLRTVLPHLDLDAEGVAYDLLTLMFLTRSWMTFEGGMSQFYMAAYVLTLKEKEGV